MGTLAQDLWDSAAQPLNDEFYGVSVTYKRGSSAGTPLTATPESIPYSSIDNEGMTTTATGRNYTFNVADCPYAEPLPGDQIIESINGTSCTFEVAAPAGKRAGRLLNGGTRWLVHTEKIK